jgi:hypothetical protein
MSGQLEALKRKEFLARQIGLDAKKRMDKATSDRDRKVAANEWQAAIKVSRELFYKMQSLQ